MNGAAPDASGSRPNFPYLNTLNDAQRTGKRWQVIPAPGFDVVGSCDIPQRCAVADPGGSRLWYVVLRKLRAGGMLTRTQAKHAYSRLVSPT